MGKYQLDAKGKAAVAKYHEKQKPAKFDKKQQLEKIRTEYLKNKQKQADKEQECKYSKTISILFNGFEVMNWPGNDVK